eukprot:358299-Chlamydomonas_euryale.AAC.15
MQHGRPPSPRAPHAHEDHCEGRARSAAQACATTARRMHVHARVNANVDVGAALARRHKFALPLHAEYTCVCV